MNFEACSRPYERWLGPFCPSRGRRSGFRVVGGRLGTWVDDIYGQSFWEVQDTRGADLLVSVVSSDWQGGRVLLLPDGTVVKPLQENEEVGHRCVIGRFSGDIWLHDVANDEWFDLSDPGCDPGDPWPGPKTTGLECVMTEDGSLTCTWYHPTEYGRQEQSCLLREGDTTLAAGFRKARRGGTSGRIRITANGHVITNRKDGEIWNSYYVGWVNPSSWSDWTTLDWSE